MRRASALRPMPIGSTSKAPFSRGGRPNCNKGLWKTAISLQRTGLRSSDENPGQRCWHARRLLPGKARFLTETQKPYPISALVARFVDRLAGLSSDEWQVIQHAVGNGDAELGVLEASRNAAVALAVRDLISRTQFNQLYEPFLQAIPLESLETPANVD